MTSQRSFLPEEDGYLERANSLKIGGEAGGREPGILLSAVVH